MRWTKRAALAQKARPNMLGTNGSNLTTICANIKQTIVCLYTTKIEVCAAEQRWHREHDTEMCVAHIFKYAPPSRESQTVDA